LPIMIPRNNYRFLFILCLELLNPNIILIKGKK
jgi:hypothetical protein